MGPRFDTARFHKDFGPASLFRRVQQIMGGARTLKLHGAHFRQRADERSIPYDLLKDFDSWQWELIDAEVRVDTGKFVASSWRMAHNGEYLWIVIGLHDLIKTAYVGGDKNPGGKIVLSGSLYDLVEKVNSGLLAGDSKGDQSINPGPTTNHASRTLA